VCKRNDIIMHLLEEKRESVWMCACVKRELKIAVTISGTSLNSSGLAQCLRVQAQTNLSPHIRQSKVTHVFN
jgi:hypothetical protein